MTDTPSSPQRENHEVEALLRQLEHVLVDEKRALLRLDVGAVTQAADDKLAIRARLTQALAAEAVHGNYLPLLERVRRSALENQMLLVNARDTVRGLVQELTGAGNAGYARGGERKLSGGLRLDARG